MDWQCRGILLSLYHQNLGPCVPLMLVCLVREAQGWSAPLLEVGMKRLTAPI